MYPEIFENGDFFLLLHLRPTRKQHFRSQIWRFLKMLSRLDIYRILVDTDSFLNTGKKSPFSKIFGYGWPGPELK